MLQYLIVWLIGLVTLGVVLYQIYRLFVPKHKEGGACGGCTACPRGKDNGRPHAPQR